MGKAADILQKECKPQQVIVYESNPSTVMESWVEGRKTTVKEVFKQHWLLRSWKDFKTKPITQFDFHGSLCWQVS